MGTILHTDIFGAAKGTTSVTESPLEVVPFGNDSSFYTLTR